MSKLLLSIIAALSILPCMSFSEGVPVSKVSTLPKHNSQRLQSKIASYDYSECDSLLVTLNENVRNAKTNVFAKFDNYRVADLTTSLKDYSCKKVYSVDLSGMSYEDINRAVSDLESKDEVYCVEPDEKISVSSEPNDTRYVSGDQWGLNGTYGINAPKAWNINTGSSSVRVGVIDTGIAKHTDLNANLVDGYDFVSDTANGYSDLNGHGTHVAGIIGAVGNNSVGVSGVNWNVSLISLQASNDGSRNVSVSAAIKAINYAIGLWGTDNQIDILNFSVGGYGYNVALREAVSEYPGLFVWAVGNSKIDVDNYIEVYDSFDLSNIISVGAINSKGSRPDFSNYSLSGANVNIYAPGDNILSTLPGNKYGYMGGTSMAAPFVTGTAALLLAENPDLTANQLKNLILDNANSIEITYENDNNTALHTVKSLNAYAALSATHTHNYTYKYVSKNNKQHRSYCSCGEYKLQGHVVSGSETGSSKKTCVFCGASVTTGFVQYAKIRVASLQDDDVTYFGHRSYILPDGIYVISDEDMDAVLSGELTLPE